jgi:hypothetical protein
MSAPTSPNRDLTGKNIRSWYVVAYAGEREGVRYWRCMCRESLAEKVVAEQEILDEEVNTWFCGLRRWKEALESPSDWTYGEWTVVGPAGEHTTEPGGK